VSNPHHTLGQLRAELMELAESVTAYAPPPKPDRFDREPATGVQCPVWQVCQSPPKGRDWCALSVRCVNGEPGVFVEGANFSYYGDWHCLTSSEARSFARALLAAADWSDGQDLLGQRRARKEQEAAP
jgi:hypothetical protein